MIGGVSQLVATTQLALQQAQANTHIGTSPTEAKILSICHLLPSIARGSAAHFSLLRELANSPDIVAALHRVLPGRNANTIIPAISVIPEEVLSMIFSAVGDIAPPRGPMVYSDLSTSQYLANVSNPAGPTEKREKELAGRVLPQFGGGPSTLGFILLGHVCAAWRELLFNMPSLWGRYLGTLPGSAFDGMLYWSRSRPVGLNSLSSSMRPGSENELVAALRGHDRLAQRVVHMRLERTQREAQTNCIFNSILDDLETPRFINLSILDVSANVRYRPDQDYETFPVIDAPNLKTLRFEDYFLRWNSSVVVVLDISGAFRQLHIPVLLLMDHLRVSSTSLRVLRLVKCINKDTALAESDLEGVAPVWLPHLQYFHFGSTNVNFSAFFLTRAVAIPENITCIINNYNTGTSIDKSLPLLRFAWAKFVSPNHNIGMVISYPHCPNRQHRYIPGHYSLSDICSIEFYEGVDANDLGATTVADRRPRLMFQCSAISGIAHLEHIFAFMDNYRITVLSLLLGELFSFETKAIITSLPNVRVLHMNDFRHLDLDSQVPISVLYDSPEFMPDVETLSIVYGSIWTHDQWTRFAVYLAQRRSIRTLIVHDARAGSMVEKRERSRQAIQFIGRKDLEIRWVPQALRRQ